MRRWTCCWSASRVGTPSDFGKSPAERDKIIADTQIYEPVLRAGATVEIDTRLPLAAVADQLECLAAP